MGSARRRLKEKRFLKTRVFKALEQDNLSQSVLAERFGISQSTASMYLKEFREKGRKNSRQNSWKSHSLNFA